MQDSTSNHRIRLICQVRKHLGKAQRRITVCISKNKGLSCLRDNYVLEFLNLSEGHKEKDLRKAIIKNIKKFILEFGKDFTFIGEDLLKKFFRFRESFL